MASKSKMTAGALLLGAVLLMLNVQPIRALDTSCSDPCFSALPAQCGGSCPFQLVATAQVAYRTTNSSQLLCTNQCQAALYSDALAGCMNRGGLVNETAAVQTVKTATCPTLCFLQVAPLETFYAACGTLLTQLTTNAVVQASSCSETCRQVVEGIPFSCRSSVATSPSDAAQKAKGVFDTCNIPYMINGTIRNAPPVAATPSAAAPPVMSLNVLGVALAGLLVAAAAN
ncbi:hypothetical protein KFL_001270020 [Klebsormidium nitens]|uniref:Uncharacterized protein n=1 Tax=Klebsormidium nitens TaxID=105231 RepID=A0A1Y1I0A3_KLENI|nr:hypothetical protein KFL_001270020 [Klebsormidium nitens]|eukprot:GAQ82859.1 hypothetical protein KFL_001270020 [Klebsormidium nitens]